MYKYFNPNPKNNNANDCVIRALCKVLDKSWDENISFGGGIGRQK